VARPAIGGDHQPGWFPVYCSAIRIVKITVGKDNCLQKKSSAGASGEACW
jgi:hypothetical protein